MQKLLVCLFLVVSLHTMAQSNYKQAVDYYEAKKWDASKMVLDDLLKENPNDLRALELLGDIAGQRKQWKSALEYYKQLRNLKPSVANYHFKYGGVLGMIAKESNKFKALSLIGEVRECFEKAIALDNKHIEARWALIELYLQLPGIVGGSEKKAIRYADELMKISAVDGFLSRGHIEEYFDRDLQAETYYKRAIEVGNSKVCYQKLADLYTKKMKQPQKAKALWEKYKENK